MGRDKHPKRTTHPVTGYIFDPSTLTAVERAEWEHLPKGSRTLEWETNKGIEQAWVRGGWVTKVTHVWSFGKDNGAEPQGCERAFDCRRLNMRGHGLDLRFGRGNDPEFQAEASRDPEFLKFILLVAKCVMDNNYTRIAFYCSKGHHRSVAAATLWVTTFAPTACVVHTCLRK
jgi:hypothetical protein